MINRSGLLKKRSDMSMEEFKRFWFEDHGPIGSQMKNLRHYEQNLVAERLQSKVLPHGCVDLDGYSELWFDDVHDMEEGVASLNGAGAADLVNFTEDCKVMVYEKKVNRAVSEEYAGKKLLKRVCFLRRAEGVSAERFQELWWGWQAGLMLQVPGCLGYSQYLVLDRIIGGRHASWEEFPLDGMNEFYFADRAAHDAFFAAEEFKPVSASVRSIVGAVDSYLMEVVKYPLPGEV